MLHAIQIIIHPVLILLQVLSQQGQTLPPSLPLFFLVAAGLILALYITFIHTVVFPFTCDIDRCNLSL